MSFSSLGLTSSVCAPLARKGYHQPTPVQAEAIPVALQGRDLLARAQTGTGKTAAFGLPMIQRLMGGERRSRSRAPRGLVLVPTRELAIQVHRTLLDYGSPLQLRALAVFGGAPMGRQIQELRRGTDVVVATPGRLIDHLERRTIDLSGVEVVVLDEADRMLDMGFMPALKTVLAAVPATRQTMLFSATLSGPILRLAEQFTREAARVDVAGTEVVAASVTHRVHPVEMDRKRELLVHVLREQSAAQTLVFCKTKHGSDQLGEHLERAGVASAVIHGGKGQGQRIRALSDFRAGRVRVLVATDVAARGLDIVQLPLVVNYDLPLVAEDYVHRVGRTGRAGAAGQAVSFVAGPERSLLRDIQRLLPAPLEHVVVPGFEPAAHRPGAGRSRPPQRRFGRPHRGGLQNARRPDAWRRTPAGSPDR